MGGGSVTGSFYGRTFTKFLNNTAALCRSSGGVDGSSMVRSTSSANRGTVSCVCRYASAETGHAPHASTHTHTHHSSTRCLQPLAVGRRCRRLAALCPSSPHASGIAALNRHSTVERSAVQTTAVGPCAGSDGDWSSWGGRLPATGRTPVPPRAGQGGRPHHGNQRPRITHPVSASRGRG